MARAVGICLGTTSSAIAVMVDGRPVVVPNSLGALSTPSVVAFKPPAEVLVGQRAKDQTATNVARTVRSVKRLTGTSWSLGVDGAQFGAHDITGYILADLKHSAQTFLGEQVTGAVIAVPAGFSMAQRRAVTYAAQLADLNVLRITTESTMAALAYGRRALGNREATVLTIDVGGGACDVALLEVSDGVYDVRAVASDRELGGDHWDQRIVDLMVKRVWESHRVHLATDIVAMRRLGDAAEAAKIALSSGHTAQVQVPYLAYDANRNPISLAEALDRRTFELLTQDLLDRVRVLVRTVCAETGKWASDVDHIVLTGGASRMPAVVDMVTELAGGRSPMRGFDAGELVAQGGAIQASVLRGEVCDVLLLDIASRSVGIELDGGSMCRVVERNTTIPTKRSKKFKTNGRHVQIRVFAGEHEIASENQYLGQLDLEGATTVEVSVDVDANGVVHVTATDTTTGKEMTLQLYEGRYRVDPPNPNLPLPFG